MMSALTTAQNLLRVSIPEATDITKKPDHRVPVHGDYFMDIGSN
jgi:hypothetical protein